MEEADFVFFVFVFFVWIFLVDRALRRAEQHRLRAQKSWYGKEEIDRRGNGEQMVCVKARSIVGVVERRVREINCNLLEIKV